MPMALPSPSATSACRDSISAWICARHQLDSFIPGAMTRSGREDRPALRAIPRFIGRRVGTNAGIERHLRFGDLAEPPRTRNGEVLFRRRSHSPRDTCSCSMRRWKSRSAIASSSCARPCDPGPYPAPRSGKRLPQSVSPTRRLVIREHTRFLHSGWDSSRGRSSAVIPSRFTAPSASDASSRRWSDRHGTLWR